MKTFKKVITILVIALFLMGFFSQYIMSFLLPKVSIFEVRKMSISNTVSMEGHLGAKELIDVRFKDPLVVDDYFVEVGDAVSEGQPLFKINSEYAITNTIETQSQETRLAIKKAELELKTLKNRSFESETKAISDLVYTLSEKENEKLLKETLYETGGATQLEINALINDINSLNLNIKLANDNLTALKAQNELDIESATMVLNQLNSLQDAKSYEGDFYSVIGDDYIFYAPANGVMMFSNERHQIIQKDSVIMTIARIEESSSYEFQGQMSIGDANKIKVGDTIELTNASIQPIEGIVTYVGNIASEDNTLTLRADLNRIAYGKLYIGMPMKATHSDAIMANLAIPRSAILNPEAIKQGETVTFYNVSTLKGFLGPEYVVTRSQASVSGIGDLYIDINSFSLVGGASRVVINPSYHIKEGDHVLWERE